MASSPRKKTLYMILALLAGVLLVGIAACAGLLSWGTGLVGELPKAQASASKFLDDIDAGLLADAYESAAPSFRARLTRDQFAAFVKDHPVLRNQKKRTMAGMRIYQKPAGETVMINYDMADGDNSLALLLALTKVDGRWRIASIHVQ